VDRDFAEASRRNLLIIQGARKRCECAAAICRGDRAAPPSVGSIQLT
jgi:hypothetical protein